MKSSNAELFAQLTEVTKDLEFPISCSSNPIHPFMWEVEMLGEFNIESLLKTATPNFSEYSEGGKIMGNGDVEAYLQLLLSQAQKHSPEILQKYQTLIDLLQSHLTNLELLKIRTLHDPKDNFHIIIGMTASGEWVGISANIPTDNEDCIHSLLEAIGFARTFPVCKMFHKEEYYGEEELSDAQVYLVLDEFLEANISNLRTYMFGMTVSYVFYIVGQTSSGDWAGVTSFAAWA